MTAGEGDAGATAPVADPRAEQVLMLRRFAERAAARGLVPDPRFFWYHTIDLGDGLVTPGSFDYRTTVDLIGLPADMSGTSALDIGTATGFFAFEMERRGARVTGTEVPALARWDRFPGESPHAIAEKMRSLMPHHSVLPAEEIAAAFATLDAQGLHRVLLDGPFRFCHAALGSRVERVYGTVYELPDLFEPGRRFDLVLAGDIVLHTVDPLAALAAAARLCAGTLVVVQEMILDDDARPLLVYLGGTEPDADVAQWWRPNFPWFRQVLLRLGFAEVELVGRVRGRIRPGGEAYEKGVVHARRHPARPGAAGS